MKCPRFIFIVFLFGGQIIAQNDTINKNERVRYYFQNGILSSEGFIINGKPDGYWKNYNEDGSLKSEGNRSNGELDSTWIFYGLKSTPKISIQYKSGKKEGIKKQFGEKGEILSEETFETFGTLSNTIGEWSYTFGPEIMNIEIEFTGNTGQAVTVEAFVSEFTSIS